MIKVLYIHGLGSSSDSSTGRYLQTLNDKDITFFHPSFSLSPEKAIKEVNDYIKDNNIDFVIGSSLGGFYALQSDCKLGIVVNPALNPIEDIKNAIGYGEHTTVSGKGKYVIDEEFFIELDKIIKNGYKETKEWYKEFPKDRKFLGIFGECDELFSHYSDFRYVNNNPNEVVMIKGMGHRMSDKAYPAIRIMIDKIIDIIKNNK